jgi:hypothetical protein
MPTYTNYTLQGLMPAKNPELATKSNLALPVGGPTGVGGAYAQGACVGLIGGAVANHVFTLTLTKASATGLKGYFTYYGDRVYSGLVATGGITANSVTGFPSAAQVQAALVAAVPAWDGNVTVTGSDSANYTITFNNLMASKRVGGLLTFTVTANTGGSASTVGAITVATPGSAGSAQAELFATGGTPGRVDGFVVNSYLVDAVGGIVGGSGGAPTNQAAQGIPCWTKGIFFADNTNMPEKSVLVGSGAGYLDSTVISAAPYKIVYHSGLALTDPGVMIELL